MHVDELLSAEFPLNMGNGPHHASGPLNSGAQANIMEGLDDLFGDDFSATTTTATTVTTTTVTTGSIAHSGSNNVGLPMVHLPQPSQSQHTTVSHPQALPPNMHFSTSGPTHSPQPRVLQQHPHQQPSPAALDSPSAIPAPLTPGHHTPGARISPQTPQPVSTAHVSHAPQITPGMHTMQQNRPQAIATPGLPQQYQQQQAVLQQQQAALQQHQQQQQQQQQAAQHHAHLTQQSLQSTGAPRSVFPSPQHHHAALNQAAALLPRPVQPNIVQMPPTASTPVVPNGHTPIPTVATPAIVTPAAAPTPTPAPAAPVVLAGSPLHHILGTTSPETGQQLRDLFTLLQTNVVSPNEFLARAEQLLEPAQFKILDGIRRRHVPQAQQQQLQPQQSTPAPGASTPAANSPAATATASAASSPMHQPQPATTGIARPSGVQHISTPAVPMPVQPVTPQPTPVAPAATVSQVAPVRKRPVDPTSVANSANESKTKRPKMEQQQNAVGVGAVNGAAAGPLTPALPSASGPSTPGVAASPGAFKGVSLPGQHRAVTAAPSVATTGAAGGAGAATGATTATAGTTARSGGGGAASTEKVNYDNITDVMGYVGGVDLREETDNIMRDSDGYSKSGGGDGQDRTRIQNFVDSGLLKTIIERIAATHKIQTVEPDVLAYMAMATQERLRGLAEQMVHASKHRGRSLATANPPMYDEEHAMYRVGVSQDVKKQLLAVERVEREEETKRKEHIAERERRLAAGEDLDENGDPRGGPGGAGAKKSKKQKEGGPGVSARNMTEEARKKVANQTAMGFAGGSGRTYSWMMGSGGAGGGGGLGGGAASPSPLAGPPIVASTGTGSTAGSPSASGTAANGTGGPLKPTLARGSTMLASTTLSGALTPGGGGGDGGAAGSGAVGSPSLVRGAGVGGSMILPPSTLGRPTNLRDSSRKVNVRDALFCLERDRGGGGGEGSGQRVLVKSYVKWLK